MPPLLTIILFIWAWVTVEGYILEPTEKVFREMGVFLMMRYAVREGLPQDATHEELVVLDAHGDRVPAEVLMKWGTDPRRIRALTQAKGWQLDSYLMDGVAYVETAGEAWIPRSIQEAVVRNPGTLAISTATARDICRRYVEAQYLQRWRTIPVFLVAFTGILYLLGTLLTAGIGRMAMSSFDTLIDRLPLVRNVYSSVKQITDLVLGEHELQFNRVVAVQYPRQGIWSLGFVVGDSLMDLRAAANEPVVAVLMPTSPMPATGFVITVRKSEILDLNITLDEAIQFIVSCGVVSPGFEPHGSDIE